MLAILQARCTSRRLPGKVMHPLLGEPMIARQIERIRRARKIREIVLATSDDASDAPLADLAERLGISCFRGSLDDVLDRFYQAARCFGRGDLVRLTADCPLTDPGVLDATIDFFQQGDFDYVSNALEPTFPDGLDVEVFRFSSLEKAWRDARLPSEREHVTPYLYHHPACFRIGSFRQADDHSALRWTVDQPEDLAFVEAIYGHLYPLRPDFNRHDILELLASHPELAEQNRHIARNLGYEASLAAETRS